MESDSPEFPAPLHHLLAGCVTLGTLLTLSEPQLPQAGGDNSSPAGMMGRSMTLWM